MGLDVETTTVTAFADSGLQMQVRVRFGSRSPTFAAPGDGTEGDDALGLSVARLLTQALTRGTPPPAVLLLTGENVYIIDVVPLLQGGERLDGRAIAAFASLADVQVMAVVGVLTRTVRGAEPARCAVAFLEWPDGRWWLGRRAVVQQEGGFVLDPLAELDVERAVDGLSKPRGLGGWFRRVRVEGLQAHLGLGSDSTVH